MHHSESPNMSHENWTWCSELRGSTRSYADLGVLWLVGINSTVWDDLQCCASVEFAGYVWSLLTRHGALG